MAISGTGGVKHLSRAASFTETADWTWVFWAQVPSGAGAGVYFPLRGFGDVSYTNPYILVFVAEFNHVTLELFYGGVFHDSGFYDLVDANWHGYAVTYDATTHVCTLYQGDGASVSSVDSLTKDLSTMGFVETDEFAVGDTTTNSGSSQEYDRVFSAKLTPTQIAAELASIDPVITASLEANTRIAAQGNISDDSGNGNNWTATGTFAYASGPLPPANITPATATTISLLPYTVTSLDVQDAPTGTVETAPTCSATRGNEVWFKYTTSTTDVVLSVTVNSVLGTGNYNPRVSFWTGTPGALVQYTVGSNNFCSPLGGFYYDIPVAVSTLYYIRVDYNSTTQPLDDTLTISIDTAPVTVPTTDNLMIPDDVVNFPAMIIANSGTSLISARRFPAGEFQGTLPGGIYCVVDDATTDVAIFDQNFNQLASVSYGAGNIVRSIASNFVDTFYIATRNGSNPTVVHTLDAAGVAGPTTWTLTDDTGGGHFLIAMAPNRSDSILYFISVTDSVVYAYDLVNSIDLPDLHAGFGGELGQGHGCGFVASDGSIWFGFSTGGGANGKLRQFDSLGNVLQTWTVVDATYTQLNKFTLSTDGLSVYVWTFNAGSTVARFEQLQLSDQTVLNTAIFRVTGTSGGDSPSQWNISNSCPLIVLAATAIETLNDPIRRLRRFPIAYNLNKEQFLRRIEFVCQPGVGLAEGQGSDPTLMFRLSRDGGITWSTEQTMSIGAMGEYLKRAYLTGLGRGRQLVGEVSTTDPTAFYLIDCLATLDDGTH